MNIGSIALASALVFSAAVPVAAANGSVPHYDLTVILEPEVKTIRVKGTLRLPDSPRTIAFYLHKGLSFRTFEIDGTAANPAPAGSSDIRFMPAAAKYSLSIPPKDGASPERLIAFAYDGRLDERPEWLANVVEPNWVEIGNYLPWYPVIGDRGPFTYIVTVSAPPPYRVFAPGAETRIGGRFVFENRRPTTDIVVCAAPDLEVHSSRVDGHEFVLASCSLDSKTREALMGDVEDIYQTLERWYGRLEETLALVESKREKGGGYSRPGALFLPGFIQRPYLENLLGYRRYLTHEIAHGWWNLAEAATWHDWLNESFAEFTALLYIRDTAGPEEYQKRLDSYAGESENLPSLWELDRNHESAFQALYRKGPVLLQRLEERLGTQRFFALCRKILEKKIRRTEDFLALLRTAADEKTAAWFETLLKTY